MLNIENSLVLIIDIQEKLLNAAFNKEQILKNSSIIVSAANILDIPILATEQYPKGLGNTVSEINKNIQKENIFEKTSFSALDDDKLKNKLKGLNKHQIILLGIETHICVNQTAQALIELGYDVYAVSNASGSRLESEHLAGLNRIEKCGGNIITTEIALFELLKTSAHPKFKEVQNLIK